MRQLFALLMLISIAVRPMPAVAQHVPCDARQVFAAVRTATGGSRWDTVKELVADGKMKDGDATGSLHIARDLVRGRSVFVESLDKTRGAYIYDGRMKWESDQGFGVRALDAPDSIRRAITTAYFDRNGFWKNAQEKAAMRCERRASFDIVRIVPRGGNPIDVWVDRTTRLVLRTVQQLPTTTSVADYSDYREFDGLVLPFAVVQRYMDVFSRPATDVQTISKFHVLQTLRPSDFTRPPDPMNGRIVDGTGSTSVPFEVERGIIVFQARLNGKGPFDFVFDPGALGRLTSVVSRPLGFRAERLASIARLRVGAAEIAHIDINVFGGNPSDIFKRPDGHGQIAGAVGPELLDRFAVRLDYKRRKMTLTPLATFRYTGHGIALPFTLQEDDVTPLIPAVIEGHAGNIQYDVRSRTTLVLFAPFLARTRLALRYRSSKGTVSRILVAGKILTDVPTRFFAAHAGKFGSRTEAGLAGYGIISRFVTTLDYKRRVIYFEDDRVARE
jgi:hypothetical protein